MANIGHYMQRIAATADPATIFVVTMVGKEQLVGRIVDIQTDGFTVINKQDKAEWVNPDHVLTIRLSSANN